MRASPGGPLMWRSPSSDTGSSSAVPLPGSSPLPCLLASAGPTTRRAEGAANLTNGVPPRGTALFLRGSQGQAAHQNFLGHRPTMETSWEGRNFSSPELSSGC